MRHLGDVLSRLELVVDLKKCRELILLETPAKLDAARFETLVDFGLINMNKSS